MTTQAVPLQSAAFDAAAGSAQRASEHAGSWIRRVVEKIAARQQAAAMARLAAIDPRLAREIRAARDRAEW